MKTCKQTLTLLALILLAIALPAQNIHVSGTVVDKDSGEKIPFATIALYAYDSNELLEGVTSGLEGNFMLRDLRLGNYRLVVSFLGYNTFEIPLQIAIRQKNITLGDIPLGRSAIQLEQLEVTAMGRASANHLDRISYRAEDFETARGGTAAELISKLPSLSVSPEGEISVRGTTDFIIYLNGKPTQAEPSMLLAQIPAGSITGIDIITIPTAGFDAQGKGGIINIVTKANAPEGFSVSASGLLGGAPWGKRTDDISGYKLNDDRHGSTLNLMYANNGWVLQGGLNYNKRNVNSERSGTARILDQSNNAYKHMIASGLKPEWYENTSVSVGFEKAISKWSEISGSYFHGSRIEGRIANYLYHNFFGDIDQNPIPDVATKEEYTFNPNEGIRKGSFNTFNFDYMHKPDKRSRLIFGTVYEYSSLSQDVDNPNITYNNTAGVAENKILHYRQNDQTPLHGLRFSADYSINFANNYSLGAGFQPQFVAISGAFHYDTLNVFTDQWGTYTSLENDVELNRLIYAGYIDLAGQWKKIQFKAGLRLEYTDQALEIGNPDYFNLLNRPNQKRFDENHLDWFPSFHASYPVSHTDRLNIAANRRISRAPVKNMAPFLYRRHLEVYVVGDPELKPEYTENFEITYNKNIGEQQIGLTGFYRGVSNAVFRVNTVFEDELVLIRTFTNSGQTDAWGGELNANITFSKKAKFFLGAAVYNFHVQADVFNYREDHNSTNWNLKGNANVMLSKQLRLIADFSIRSAEVTAQGKDKMRYMANVAMTCSPDRLPGWTFNLRGLNILNSNTSGISTRAYNSEGIQVFYQDTDFRWYGPIAELSITYQFNWKSDVKSGTVESFGREEF